MSNLMHNQISYKWLGIKKTLPISQQGFVGKRKVFHPFFFEGIHLPERIRDLFGRMKSLYFFFLFCSSVEMASRMAVSAMMFLYFM